MSKHGKVFYNATDEGRFLVVKGHFSRDEILEMAVSQNVIDEVDLSDWDHAKYGADWYKTTPARRNSGFKIWNYPVKEGVKGAWFASYLAVF